MRCISLFLKIGIEIASCGGAVFLVGDAGSCLLLPHGLQDVGPLVARPHLQPLRRALATEVYRVRMQALRALMPFSDIGLSSRLKFVP